MPIKLPKGFVRRKSSGNALEEVENRPQSSFRVFERPSGDARSASEGNLLAPKKVNTARRQSQPLEDPENIFAGSPGPMSKNRYGHSHSSTFVNIRGRLTKRSDSRGTDNSAGTYESSSSLRFSSSSTDNPANESPVPENTQSSHSRGFHDIPPLTGALRAAGRTFSFGGRLSKQLSSSTPQPQPSDPSRNKTMTATSATPPKLLDTDLNLGKDNDFQSMLDNFEKPSHSQAQEPSSVGDSADPVWIIPFCCLTSMLIIH